MGGAVSSGQDNDELVDNLMESGYIRTKKVEQVFRAIDRADYILSSHREDAYKDLAWKQGNIHLSAPCVYSEVMEGLNLEPGLSFLNLGSGTGYLSTMAGLLLQQHGTNHGIELNYDCLKYAYEKLEEFKQKSLAVNEFDFCEPLFIQGNCLSIIPGRQYDRVYCGAACPESHEAFIKQFVRVGGILVMPFKDHLLRVKRVDENTWMHFTMLPVSFATLIVPSASEHNLLHLPESDPMSLQELCRGKIRHRLRQNIWHEHADVEMEKLIVPGHRVAKPNLQQRALRRFVIPIFEEADDVWSDEEQDYPSTLSERRARFLLNVDAHQGEAITTTLQLVRAVIQPNLNDGRENQREDVRTVSEDIRDNIAEDTRENNRENNREIAEDASVDEQYEQRRKCAKKNSYLSTNDENTVGHSSIVTADTIDNSNEARDEKESSSTAATYSNMSESESDPEQENTFAQHKQKISVKRKKTDSGIVEDVNFDSKEGSQPSSQSSSQSSNSNNSNSSDSDVADAMDIDDLLPSISLGKSYKKVYPSKEATSSGKEIIAHYVNSNAFAAYMGEKIQQLPLPYSVKLYINYNRTF